MYRDYELANRSILGSRDVSRSGEEPRSREMAFLSDFMRFLAKTKKMRREKCCTTRPGSWSSAAFYAAF